MDTKERPHNFNSYHVKTSASDQIFVRDVCTAILLRVEEAKCKPLLEADKALHKGDGKRLLAALETSIERTAKKIVNVLETSPKIAVAFIDNPGYVISTTVQVNSKHRERIDERAMIEEYCRLYVLVAVKFDPVAFSHHIESVKKPHTDILD